MSIVEATKEFGMLEGKVKEDIVKIPKKYLNDETAIATNQNENGVLTFKRCKPQNVNKYASLKTKEGVIRYNQTRIPTLKNFKMSGD